MPDEVAGDSDSLVTSSCVSVSWNCILLRLESHNTMSIKVQHQSVSLFCQQTERFHPLHVLPDTLFYERQMLKESAHCDATNVEGLKKAFFY